MIFVIRFLLFVAAPTIRAFPAVPVSHRRQGKACRRRLSAAQIRRKGEKCIAGAWCRFDRWWCERLWSGREVRAWARGDRLARGHDCGSALKKSDGFAAQPVTRDEAVSGWMERVSRTVESRAAGWG